VTSNPASSAVLDGGRYRWLPQRECTSLRGWGLVSGADVVRKKGAAGGRETFEATSLCIHVDVDLLLLMHVCVDGTFLAGMDNQEIMIGGMYE
jgi:hypothetical protein